MAERISGWIRWSGMAAALLLVSCAKDQDPEIGRPPEAARIGPISDAEAYSSLEDRFAMKKEDLFYTKEGTLTSSRRSQYEGKKQVAFGGEWTGQSYGKQEYSKTAWGGSRERATKSFDKGEDGRFRFASLFGGKKSAQAGQRSNYDGRTRAKETVGTGAAYEASRSSVARPEDAKAAWRRSVYPQPRIETLADVQRMNVEETRSLLGRDD